MGRTIPVVAMCFNFANCFPPEKRRKKWLGIVIVGRQKQGEISKWSYFVSVLQGRVARQ